jgi:uncharacterized membrane protein
MLVAVLAVTGVVMVVLRASLLADTLPPVDAYDAGFVRHAGLTLVHMVPGLVFVVLGPLQFVTRIRTRYIGLHRWCGRTYVASGVAVGISALVMGVVVDFGGPTETAAVTLFSTLFLIFLGLAVFRIRRREVAAHREWMIRAFALGLAVTTMRPIAAILMAVTGLPLSEILGISFWLAFSLHLVLAECWIKFTRVERKPVNAGAL